MSVISGIWTGTVAGATLTIQAGAKFIALKNNSSAIVTYTGNAPMSGAASTPVTLDTVETFAFPELDTSYPALEIDASLAGAECEITVVY